MSSSPVGFRKGKRAQAGSALGEKLALERRFKLRGKVAAIVGGSGYLGTAIARGMREAEMTVVILDLAAPERTSSDGAGG